MTNSTSLVPLFNPKGVVVIGASQDPTKLGYGLANNLSRSGYKGAIYFVNLKGGTLLGKPIYKSVLDVPDPVDLATVLIPAQFVTPVLKEIGKRGIKAVIIGAGGFRESGPEGLLLEQAAVMPTPPKPLYMPRITVPKLSTQAGVERVSLSR